MAKCTIQTNVCKYNICYPKKKKIILNQEFETDKDQPNDLSILFSEAKLKENENNSY